MEVSGVSGKLAPWITLILLVLVWMMYRRRRPKRQITRMTTTSSDFSIRVNGSLYAMTLDVGQRSMMNLSSCPFRVTRQSGTVLLLEYNREQNPLPERFRVDLADGSPIRTIKIRASDRWI